METCINIINEKVRKTKFYQLLKTSFGEDNNKILEYYIKVTTKGEFSDAFRNYYFNKHHPTTLIHFDNFDEKVLLDTITEFINNDNPDGNNTIERKESNDVAGFVSKGDRRYCVQRVAKQLNSIWSNHHYNLHDDEKLAREDFYNILTSHFYVAVLDKTASVLGISKKDIAKYYDGKKAKELSDALQDDYNLPKELANSIAQKKELINACKRILGDNATRQINNLIATVESLLDYTTDIDGVRIRDKFINDVMLQGEVSEFKKHLYKIEHKVEEGSETKENEAVADAINDGVNVDETGVSLELQRDETLKDLDSHDGQFANVMMHVNNTTQAYFNSLPKLRTTHRQNDTYDYDTNNPIGLSDTMTAVECTNMLLSRAKTNGSIDEFIESIREIAESVPGFECFIKLYDELRGYIKTQTSSTGEVESVVVPPNYAFAEELYDTFSKTVVAKKELYIDKEGNLNARISNNMTNAKDSLRLQCIRSVRNSAISLNYVQSIDEFNSLVTRLNKINKFLNDGKTKEGDIVLDYNTESEIYLADKRALINDIYKVFKWYYTNVSLASILNYVNNNLTKNVNTDKLEINEIKNLNNLLNLLNDTIIAGKETRDNYEAKIDRVSQARYHNETLNSRENEDLGVDESEYIDLKDIYKVEHLSERAKSTAIAVADALLPYTNVKTKYNSRNAAGNNSSDVLNNNMLTYLKRILEHEANVVGNKQSPLAQFAKYKFRNNQYDDSNLLIEHRDANGNIENVGLFRIVKRFNAITNKTETIYEPTKYATELIKVTLFNGTSDHLKAQAALYAQMSKGDYLVSAFASFYNSIKDPITPNGEQTVTFADYFLRTPSDAPKNFILSLPRYSVNGLIGFANEGEINVDIEQRLNDIVKTEDKHGVKYVQNVNNQVIFDLLTNKEVDRIYINRDNYRNTEDGCYVIVSANDTNVLIKGSLVKNGNSKYVEDISVIGVVETDGKSISESLTNQLKDYYRTQLLSHSINLLNGEKAKRIINRNHPIYRQFYRTLNQEITNAATALTTLFEKVEKVDETGKTITVFVDNGTLKWNSVFAKSDDPDNMTEEIYHHRKGEPVFVKDENGFITLTGKAFSSDRFTKFSDIFDDETGKHEYVNENYFEDLFADGIATEEDGRIHMLYGGYNTHLHLNSDGSVVLTEAQQVYVESRLDAFIEDYVDATFTRLGEFENTMPEDVPHDFNASCEFILNYRLAYFACADLLEGDSKCYKDFTDFLKRAKEVQGAGIPYSALDYTRQICASREALRYSSLNSNSVILDLNKRNKLHDCITYNTFRGVTVRNTVRTSKGTQNEIRDNLAEVIINSYKEAGSIISKEQARVKADYIMGGYRDVKTNDAQSYITFEEWIRRISMRGQLPKYESLIKRICDDSRPITIDDINEFIQVQKNFYYDLYYDKNTNHMRPRQIKNAEFVLVPRFIRGTQLEQVYNTMVKHGIDQLNTVETSKAGKANVLTLWDNDGNLNEDWFNNSEEFNTKVQQAIELYDYNFLYTQQETPQHANTENKAAIQLMKKVVDNIPQYINGKEHPLWKFKVRFHDLYSQNIKESNQDLLQKLNIKYSQDGSFSMTDDGGILGMDAEVFCSMLRDELIRQGSDSQLLDYATLNTTPVTDVVSTDGFGLDTKMPIIANNAVRYKFENIAQALFNSNVTRQTLPGFHAAQITGIGWKNDKDVTFNLRPDRRGIDLNLKQTITSEEWKKLDKKDRVKYIPTNGIGVSNDLAYHPAQYKHEGGFHTILEREYNELTEEMKKHYKLVSPATYIEIRIPKSMFNFKYRDITNRVKSDDELLLELQNAGLDEIIGYRIPTEGKQSIAIMKVVGFIDDSYGSTIVVPDDWVAQTGSDFDIDSVYSVVYNNRVNNRTGRIEKIKYKTNATDYKDYISYIDRRRKLSISKKLKKSVDELVEELNKARSNEWLSLNEDRDDIYEKLPEKVKGIIKVANQVKQAGLTNNQVLIQRCQNIINDLNTYLNNHDVSDVDELNINDFINITQKLLNNAISDKYNKELSKGTDELYRDEIKRIEKIAKDINLPTYEEFLKLNDIERNSKRARTNALISSMIDILKSDWSLEENLSQSNFREITNAKKKVLEFDHSYQVAKDSRSPYDFMAQVDNQEEAISGRTLKGISVASNNTISIANTIRPILSDDCSITITYPKEVRGLKLNVEALKRRFNTFKTDEKGKELLDSNGEPLIERENVYISDVNGKPNQNGGYITIRHDKFGWSNDNRNVVEFLTTAYCSQTTAHQLDVIKEGSIPNVNDYTFNVYMLFPSIGSNYDTAIAFMTQPAITRIINAYNRSKSIYSNKYENPIRSAIIELAQETNPTIKYYSEAIEHLKSLSDNTDNVLNYDNLIKRKKSTDVAYNTAFDYAVIRQFIKFKEISDRINQYTFVLNPDKYAAKQTIFATNEVLNRIDDILTDSNPVFKTTYNSNGEPCDFLEAVFPGISYAAKGDFNEYLKHADDSLSRYKPMHSFMKYATIPSIMVNRRLFKTQDPKFRNIVESLKEVMSGKSKRLTEDTDNNFTSYIISKIYSSIPILSKPIGYRENGTLIPNLDGNSFYEKSRIYGIVTLGNFDIFVGDKVITFNPSNKLNPTANQIRYFLKMSPAQKVAWCKRYFKDSLVCKYFDVDLSKFNQRNQFNPNGQTIEFLEDIENIENVYEDFRNTFHNSNIFLKLTAIDLIKYAYIVEGRTIKRNAVTKAIPNDILLESLEEGGTGIIDSLKGKLEELIDTLTKEDKDKLIEDYIRGHANMKEISQVRINTSDRIKFLSGSHNVDGMYVLIDFDRTHDFLINKGIIYEDINPNTGETEVKVNSYVNVGTYIKGKYVETLYKIVKGKYDNQYILYPLNNLESNEFGVKSINPDYYKHYKPDYYERIIRAYKTNNEGLTFKDYYEEHTDESKKEAYKLQDISSSTEHTYKQNMQEFDIYSEKAGISQLRDAIRSHFNNGSLTSSPLYVESKELKYIVKSKINPYYINLDGQLYGITRVPKSVFEKYANKNTPVSDEDYFLTDIINKLRSYNADFSKIDDSINVYCIRPVNTVFSSTTIEVPVAEAVGSANKLINSLAASGDKNAERTAAINFRENIGTDGASVEKKLELGLINLKEWASREAELLINGSRDRPGLNMFYKDDDTGRWLTMVDDKVFAKMLDDPKAHRAFIKTYLDALRFIERFEQFDGYLQYTDDEIHLQHIVDEINKIVDKVKNNDVFKKAERLYVTEHLAKVSKDPNIQRNIISLLDGFHRTSFLTSHVNDLQDTSNPIIQIITKTSMANIRAAELAMEGEIDIFDSRVKDIFKRAKDAGFDINYDKFIDENGDWRTDYTEDFVNHYNALVEKKKQLYENYLNIVNNKGSEYQKSIAFNDYLKARHEFDAFVLKHVNREIEDNYYHELLLNEEQLMNSNGDFIDIYVEFERLSDRKVQLSEMSDADGGLDDTYKKELDDITRRLSNLCSLTVMDEFGYAVSKDNDDEIEFTNDEEKDRILRINSIQQANQLLEYLKKKDLIQKAYINYDEKDSFRDLYERYIEIVNRWEDRDPITNSPRRSETELSTIPEYTNAKQWLRDNSISRYGLSKVEVNKLTDDDITNYLTKFFNGEIKEDSDEFKYVLASAVKYFRTRKGSKSNPNTAYKRIAKERDARDADYVIDARKFTREDLELIKQEELERLGLTESTPYAETAIIKNAHPTDVIFKPGFYNQMVVGGVLTEKYKETIRKINDILRKAYVVQTKTVQSAYKLSEDDLTQLLELFKDLGYDPSTRTFDPRDAIKKKTDVDKSKAKLAAEFVKKTVSFEISDEECTQFEIQKAKAESRGESYFKLWCEVNEEFDEDKNEMVPNHLLWGRTVPKEKYRKTYIDVRKTAALKATTFAYVNQPSKYYEAAQADMIKQYGRESSEYAEWFDLNHVYNPNTHQFEPLACWTVHSLNPKLKQDVIPNYTMRVNKVKEGHENKNYKKGLGYKDNFKSKSTRNSNISDNIVNSDIRTIKTTRDRFVKDCIPDDTYDSNLKLNVFEEEIRDYFKQTISKLVKTKEAKKHFERSLPFMSDSALAEKPNWLREIAKTFGLVDTNRKVYWSGDGNIGYDNDYVPSMPMMHQITSRDTVNPPIREKYNTQEAYDKALKDYDEHKKEIDKKNEEIHRSLLDRDWPKVIKEFMRQAAHYNAIQNEKYALYFGQKLLEDITVYETRPDTHNILKKKGIVNNENEKQYKRSADKNLQEQYNNWLYRVIYDYYKQSQGIGERIGTVLQGFTSTSYMTLNLRAGIANVLVGESSVLGEAFAAQYFGINHWAMSKRIWGRSILDYIKHSYDDGADTITGAIIKGMHVVDYSELNGRVTLLDLKKWSKVITDIGFSPNNAGEHMMQNGAMIAMMLSHKVIENPNYGRPGEKKYIVVNFQEYTENVREEVLRQVLTKEQAQQYDKWIASIKKDPNGAKNFAWYRDDPISHFMLFDGITKEQRSKFKKLVKDRKLDIKKTFDEAKTLYDQFDKNDAGHMCFKEGSIFDELNHKQEGQEISDAYLLLGEFKGRVISVNKKIHGSYGKLDAAQIEKYYLGRLTMQYHKHIPTGILKRYRREGYYNEERGTVEKGMYTTLYDFLKFPVKQLKMRNEISDDQEQALSSLQNIFSYCVDYFKFLGAYIDVMPDYEVANFKRMLGNIAGMLVGVAGAFILKVGWDEDDEDGVAYNLLMYECDRLISETIMWTPTGAISEFRKQWSSPIAAGSIIQDAYKIMETCCGIIFQGSDYDPYYHTGRFANRHKLGVYFERRLPYYRNYAAIRDIADNNHFYKLGNNLPMYVAEGLANVIRGDK